jgi:glycosyltransferase involved in cell wall biosynthesis
MRTLTLINQGTMGLDSTELVKKENSGEIPRIMLFSQTLNSEIMDERFLRNLSLKKENRFEHFPVSVAQILEAYRIRNQYDAIISWTERLGIPFALLLKMTGVRIPHIGIFSWISGSKKAFLLKRAQSHFDKIILMSSAQRDIAVNKIGIAQEKIVLLRWPIDQLFWTPEHIETDMICTVGREMRDYRTFLMAMEGLPIRCHIAAGGRTTDKNDEWRKVLANVTSTPENITIGNVPFDKLRAMYARSRFVVVPLLQTDTDNGSTTVLEAMAMGKAVICTKVSGQRDIIQDGKNGIFVPQGDVRALRNAIEYLWNNPEIAEIMGKAGRSFIESHHTLDKFVNDVRDTVDLVVREYELKKKGFAKR